MLFRLSGGMCANCSNDQCWSNWLWQYLNIGVFLAASKARSFKFGMVVTSFELYPFIFNDHDLISKSHCRQKGKKELYFVCINYYIFRERIDVLLGSAKSLTPDFSLTLF